MKKLFLALSLLLFAGTLSAQDFDLLQYIILEGPSDYAHHRDVVLACADRVIETPIGERSTDAYRQSRDFLARWVRGADKPQVVVDESVVPFWEDDPTLLWPYVAGWTRYSLRSGDSNAIKGTLAGMEALIECYVNNRDELPENDEIEKMIGLQKEGRLKSYIRKLVKASPAYSKYKT